MTRKTPRSKIADDAKTAHCAVFFCPVKPHQKIKDFLTGTPDYAPPKRLRPFGGDPRLIPFSDKGVLCPLPAGFPLMSPTENTFGGDPDRSPLKGNPPFRGTPSALRHKRRRSGTSAVPQIMPLAMRPLREEMAHCRRTLRPALGTHLVAAELARGAFAPVQVFAGRLQLRISSHRV